MGFELFFQKLFEYIDQIIPFAIVDQYEYAVLVRKGKKKKTLKTGFHFLPLKFIFLDKVLTVLKEKDTFETNVNVTTTDGKSISVTVVVEFSIDSEEAGDNFLLHTNHAPSNAKDITAGVTAEYLCDCDWEEVKKKTTRTNIKNKLKEPLDEMGMNVKKVLFKNIIITRSLSLFNA